VWFLSALLLTVPTTSAAQGLERRQIVAGYSGMIDITDHVTFPLGWFVGAAGHLTPWLSVVADADGQYKTSTFIDTDIHLTSYSATAGARASAGLGRFVEFGQMVAGIVLSRGTVFGSSSTTKHAIIQPGVGVDYPLNARWAVRAELDMRFLSSGHEIRAATGLVRAFR
jgi:outer membrane protein with beta-barrel domain